MLGLWALVRDHRGVLLLTTIAAFSQLQYELHGPPAHVILLPALALVTFLTVPLWGTVIHDSDDTRAHLLSSVGAVIAFTPALYWAYAAGGRAALKADGTPMIAGAVVGTLLVTLSLAKGQVSPSSWGLGPGDWRWWGRPVGLLLLLIAVAIPVVAWLFPEFVSFYPRYKPARSSAVALVQYQLAMGVYMFCWEFFFRGYLLFGLERSLGAMPAILLQASPFFLMHHNKPEPEFISSWFGGVLMGWLCLKSKSMWPSFLLHWVLYSSMEITAFIFRHL